MARPIFIFARRAVTGSAIPASTSGHRRRRRRARSRRRRPLARLFLSYGRDDAGELADHLEKDLSLCGYEVWRDTRKIRSGKEWEHEIVDGLRSTQLVVALLGRTPPSRDADSVCLDELSFARFACKSPIVPVMAVPCEPPFVVFRLDYVDLTAWRDSPEAITSSASAAGRRDPRPIVAASRLSTGGGSIASSRSTSRPTCTASGGTSAAGSGCSSGSTPGGPIRAGIVPC